MRSSTHASVTPDNALEHAPHLYAAFLELSKDLRTVALDESEIEQGDGKIRVRIDSRRRRPADLAAPFGCRRAGAGAAAEEMDEEVKAAGGNAPNVVLSDAREFVDAIAGLLEQLAPGGVLEPLGLLYASAQPEPRARERTRNLLNDQDPSPLVDAGDDRGDPGRPAHGR